MAGSTSRTVTLNVIGNTQGASKALTDVATQSESAGKRASAAFGGVLSMLNNSGVLGPFGESIEKMSGLIDTLGEHGKTAGAKLAGIGAAGIAVGGIFTAIGDKDKAASQQLKASVEAVGGSWDEAKDKFEGVIKSNEKYGDSAKTTQDALSILTTGLHSADKATDSMASVLDLAAKRHESLTQAATDWVKINEGKGAKILATLGIAHTDNAKAIAAEEKAQKASTAADDAAETAKQKLADLIEIQHGKATLTVSDHIALRNAQEKVTETTDKQTQAHKDLASAQDAAKASTGGLTDAQQVAKVTQGQAAAAADTFTGHLKALTVEVEDQAAKIGAKYGPALTGIAAGISVLGAGVEGASAILSKFKGAQEAATVATEALTVATEEQDVAEGIALAPILLIIAAVVAVGVAIYEMWTHWDTIWGWIKGAAQGVWNWIKSNWPLLLGILLGPIGLAVGEIIKHWDTIKDGFTKVKDWIGDRISDIVGFFTSMPKRISDAVSHAFDSLVSAFKNAAGDMLKAIPGGGVVASVLDHLPHFAAGGAIAAGQLSVVGENGPELFMSGSSGTVIPNHALGGGNVSVGAINVYAAQGQSVDQIAAAVRTKLLQAGRANVNVGLS